MPSFSPTISHLFLSSFSNIQSNSALIHAIVLVIRLELCPILKAGRDTLLMAVPHVSVLMDGKN